LTHPSDECAVILLQVQQVMSVGVTKIALLFDDIEERLRGDDAAAYNSFVS
jgi:hypothetical protein